MNDQASAGPLPDVRVLDLADEKGAYCTKLLADLGADVIKVEPPGGDPTRRFGPFWRDTPDPDGSLFFWYHNTNKRSVVLDLDSPAGQDALRDLTAGADILVDTFPVGHLAARGLDYAALAARNPGLIQTSITPFGQTGPRAGWTGNDLTAWAMGGVALVCGDAGKPPLRGALGQANVLASEYAIIATLAALHHQRRTGEGQTIDVSMQEACLLHSEAVLLFYQYWQMFVQRLGRGQHSLAVPIIAARNSDGFTQAITYSRAQWDDVVRWLDSAGMAGDLADDRWRDPMQRFQSRGHVHSVIEAFAARFDKQDFFSQAQQRHLAFGAIQSPDEVVGDPGLNARGYFADVETPAGRVRFPGAPYRFSETPWAIRAPAEGLGDGGQGTGSTVQWRQRADPRPPNPEPCPLSPSSGPLAGLRILDFTWVLAGPFATMLLADLGADVIKVEAPEVGDVLRAQPPLYTNGTAPNHGAFSNVMNRNKRSFTINFKHPAARDLARRLVDWADIVIENFSPGTFERLIGDPEEWRRERPDLIVVRTSGFGQTGPRQDFMGYYCTLQAISGITHLTSYAASEPVGLGTSYSDYIGGLTAATAVLAALHHRTRTGRGQTVDVAQVEAMTGVIGPALLDYTVNGRVMEPAGNRLAERPDAPQGIYPCRVPDPPAQGPPETEAWLAIAVTEDDQWEGLRRALGDPKWTHDPEFATAAGRAAAADRIDAKIAAWTRERDAQATLAHLQAHGVPAGVAQNGRDILERDNHLAERGYFVTVTHPEAGEVVMPGPAFKLGRTPAAIRRPPPLLGEHTEEVLREHLHLTEDEIGHLLIEEAI